MNYKKIYNKIIEKRKINIPAGYTEEHHIIPRSLGGGNDKSNLVKLTAKEHFICHLLLTKIYEKGSLEYYKMSHAFLMMLISSNNQQRYISSKKYEKLKVSFSERMSIIQNGENNSQYGMMWIHNKTLKQCKKVPKDSILENGWENGRVLDWDKYFKIKLCLKCNVSETASKKAKYCNDCNKSILIQWASEQTKLQYINGHNIPKGETMWIHHSITGEIKRVSKNYILEDGWILGRKERVIEHHICKVCGIDIKCYNRQAKYCNKCKK